MTKIRWEYEIIAFRWGFNNIVNKTQDEGHKLNNMGQEGWELVSVIKRELNHYEGVFKRRKNNDKD